MQTTHPQQPTSTEALESTTDGEGYFVGRIGQRVGAYELVGKAGQGMFGSVYFATHAGRDVAVKVVRQNESMVRASQREAQVVKEVAKAGAQHVVALLDEFMYKGHYCIVLERMRTNLRQLLDEKGRGAGLNIAAVRLYAGQLFAALHHLHDTCQVYHCDIKPDNILADQSLRGVKLADFGSALHPFEAQPQSSLGSRFYRSPEVIVGYRWNGETDVWSLGATLAELYTGAVLFPGEQNNDMLWWFMQYKGKFPPKMAREGRHAAEHFTPDLLFVHEEHDRFGKAVFRRLAIKQPTRRLIATILPEKARPPQRVLDQLYNLNDLLEKAFVLDPDKRITARAALLHPFCAK